MAVEKLIVDHIDTWTTALQTRSTAGRGSSGKIDLYGIKKLRELILELAVRGKLVPQDPNDEPASELLKRIAAEKAELVKQGKIKKPKPLPEISEEEKPFELPVGWEWVRLNDVAEYIQRGKGPKYSEHGHVRVVSQKCVQWNGFKLEQSRWITDESVAAYTEERFLKDGDVLWNSTGAGGTAGRVIYLPAVTEKLVVDSHVTLIRTIKQNGQFICNYISTYGIQQRFDPKHPNTLLSGTTNQAELNASVVTSFMTPFPPQKEQERINSKVAELMSLCDQLELHSLTSLDAHQQLVETLLTTLTDSQNADELAENWARISEHFDTLFTTEASIDALKQTILQLAVMGKLVPQDPNDEPASELLKRIAQEKAQLVKDGKIKKQKPLPPISDEEKPFELPIGWEWCRLGECINLISGQHLKPDEYEEECHGEMLPYITGPAEFGLISPTYSKYTNEKRAIAAKGDILITCKGAGLGKLNVADTNIAISRQLMAINVIRMNSEYLKIILDSMYGYFQSKGVGIAIPGISREDVMEPLIMLPPFEEQKRIMENLYKLNFLIEDIKFRIKSAQQTQLHLADALTDAAIN
ncbi:restriction endonuclease subunit S [Salmonella enterica]|uniref:restriction endonuclease subunit S n=1 Tax=Salmonella enterica TaxID=28901 RepID=UPI0009A992D4|nr:restriction endonuclease subunit S [Salmonella enterica]EBD1319084.1 restriction endonuclease subunit S [Salmonella enterica subsp. enterica serovar Choleraesuis]HAU2929386.1 restriction endonuclease subunit S [Salmonella enterica subsp. enterica serovar Decatur]